MFVRFLVLDSKKRIFSKKVLFPCEKRGVARHPIPVFASFVLRYSYNCANPFQRKAMQKKRGLPKGKARVDKIRNRRNYFEEASTLSKASLIIQDWVVEDFSLDAFLRAVLIVFMDFTQVLEEHCSRICLPAFM